MQSSRDSSVWRTLAVAFGDGLAFGAGVSLTRSAARLAAPRSTAPDLRPLNERLNDIEQRIEQSRAAGMLPVAGAPLNHKAADAVLKAIDGRFTEIGGQIDRRLAELEVKVKIELETLDAQDHALASGTETRIEGLRAELNAAIAAERQSIDADMRSLRAQMASIHKEFAETLARLVDEQITKTVTARLQVVEEQLCRTIGETVREESRRNGQEQEIARLRERVENQEGNLLNLVMSMGQSLLQTAERLTPAEPPTAPPEATGGGGGGAAPTEVRAEGPANSELPGFARAGQQKPLWRIPIVPCFLVATGSLLLLHYL